MATPVDIHRLAIREAQRAERYYAKVGARVLARFTAAFSDAIARIAANPGLGSPHLRGTRIRRLRRFPFQLVYVTEPTGVLVIAVAHGRRRPGYWRRRLP